jgi:predicted DNA-binding transcriptional regulator YafY
MSRAESLLELMQSLRLRRRPVAGQALAEELKVSLRTLYRDIEALKAQGARTEGGAGFGYVLRPGFTLPPLMFSVAEVEALALGARWVEGRADKGLTSAARGALAKIAAVLPPERAEALDWPTMLAGGEPGE